MDNTQILQKLRDINNISDHIERIVALKDFEKEYRKTKFYKQTHLTVKQLQQELLMSKIQDTINKLSNPEEISNFISNIIKNIDTSTLDYLFNKIVDNLSLEGLDDARRELVEQTNKFFAF